MLFGMFSDDRSALVLISDKFQKSIVDRGLKLQQDWWSKHRYVLVIIHIIIILIDDVAERHITVLGVCRLH